jgi:hypothetical protein
MSEIANGEDKCIQERFCENTSVEAFPRVAVLAVHGVNAAEPFDTARSIAQILLGSTKSGDYPDFKETQEHVLVEPVEMGKAEELPRREYHKLRLFDDRAPSIRLAQENQQDATVPVDHSYMADQIREYTAEGKDAFYNTIKIDGTRQATEGHSCCDVHVFELFWADLSRRAFGAFQGFIELYEILFFLCTLGRKTLDFARAAHPKSKSWRTFGMSQALAEHILVLAIPVANLCLLALGILVVPVELVPAQILLAILSTVYVAVLLGVVCNWLLRLRFQSHPILWPCAAILIGSLAVAAGLFAGQRQDAALWSRDLCLVIALLFVVGICSLYDRTKRGALFSGVIGAITTLTVFMCPFFQLPLSARGYTLTGPLQPVEGTAGSLLWLLNLGWSVLLILIGLMAVAGNIASKNCCRHEARCRRAAWTAHVTLILPLIFILMLTSAFWKIIASLVGRLLSPTASDTYKLNSLLDQQINIQGGNLVFLGLGVALAAAASAWSLLPVILAEVFPPAAAESSELQDSRSVWMGFVLNYAYRTMRVAGEFLRLVVAISLLGLFLGWIVDIWKVSPSFWTSNILFKEFHKFSQDSGATTVAVLGAGVALILTTSTGPLSFLVLGFRSVINIALDVVAWLRLRPASQNPKGRICARYASMLRHICAKQTAGAGYDALVVVAYSQGVMLTVDLLRFLTFQYRRNPASDRDPALEPLLNGSLPIYLLTFGSPIRQLYDLRFPHLYEWSYSDNYGPDPSSLGVRLWLNGYRSGDYVGRFLWQKSNDANAWKVPSSATDPIGNLKQEFCLGEGGHTHYFDESAPTVPEWLNQVITLASGASRIGSSN